MAALRVLRIGLTSSSARALALYAALTCALTWPLVTVLDHALPQDLGDPLINCWALAWDGDHLLRILGGQKGALAGFWHANIFHPEPYTLAYSEHLVGEAVLVLPVYALTRNVVLSYNLLFLSTFILSGLGVFLLVREVLGREGPALLAGLVYGFLPYRVDHFVHLQVLSSQWMPFVLWGLVRYLDRGRRRALIAAASAWLLQGLSCGYYLLFFPPFLVLFVLFELHRRDRLLDGRVWRDLAVCAVAVTVMTAPFVIPYARLRTTGELRRSLTEVASYSADIQSYVSADEGLRFWGPRLRGVDRNELQLFPGLTPLLMCLAGLPLGVARWRRERRDSQPSETAMGRIPPQRALTPALLSASALCALLAVLAAIGCPLALSLGFVDVTVRSPTRAALLAAVAFVAAWLRSSTLRETTAALSRSRWAFFVLGALLAVWLSLGPIVHNGGSPTPAFGLYRVLYEHAPGFDGARVPARMAMLAGLFLAVLTGFAAAEIERRSKTALVWAIPALAFILEASAAPIPTYVVRGPEAPPAFSRPSVYDAVAELPADAVLVEFPFGDPYDEVAYMFRSTEHWRPLLNGYSSAEPPRYRALARALGHPLTEPETAWAALAASGATHAIVHEGRWQGQKGARLSAWLAEHGSLRVSRVREDALWRLPRGGLGPVSELASHRLVCSAHPGERLEPQGGKP